MKLRASYLVEGVDMPWDMPNTTATALTAWLIHLMTRYQDTSNLKTMNKTNMYLYFRGRYGYISPETACRRPWLRRSRRKASPAIPWGRTVSTRTSTATTRPSSAGGSLTDQVTSTLWETFMTSPTPTLSGHRHRLARRLYATARNVLSVCSLISDWWANQQLPVAGGTVVVLLDATWAQK